MKVELIAADGHILIPHLPASIGRSPHADIRLDDPNVSPWHCFLIEQGSLLLIRDFGSANGTFVNGGRVHQRVLTSGDCVSLGRRRFLVLFEPVSASAHDSTSPSEFSGAGCGALPGQLASLRT